MDSPEGPPRAGSRPARRRLGARIEALATRHQGLVTRAQLVRAGLSSSAVVRRVAAGRLVRVPAAAGPG